MRTSASKQWPDPCEVLWLKTQGRFAGFRVERYRVVLMRHHPFTINPAVANGGAPPHIELSSIRPRCADPVEAVAEGHVMAGRDAQVANLQANRALE